MALAAAPPLLTRVNLTAANDTPTLSTPTAGAYTDTSANDTFSNDTGTLAGADRDSGQTLTYLASPVARVSGTTSTKAGSYGTLTRGYRHRGLHLHAQRHGHQRPDGQHHATPSPSRSAMAPVAAPPLPTRSTSPPPTTRPP